MATKRNRPETEEWDGEYVVEPVSDEVDAMPKRAAGLPTQNGSAMRAVFAYLLDEDAPPAPPPPPKATRKRR